MKDARFQIYPTCFEIRKFRAAVSFSGGRAGGISGRVAGGRELWIRWLGLEFYFRLLILFLVFIPVGR